MKDKIAEKLLLFIAFSAILSLLLITFFIFQQGIPLIFKVGLSNFFSTHWAPTRGNFGILSMIIGSLMVTAGALVVGIPFGLACAIFLAEFSSPPIQKTLKPIIELLAGIPSVVYGFIGIVILVPFIREHFGGPGFSVLAASIILGIMILPTIVSISYDALLAVPNTYREGSYAVGATKWQTVVMLLLPAARSGIVAGIILGMGRAIGETMAVIMIAGNALKIPHSMLDSVRTLTSTLALELGYATGDHRAALFACGSFLFLIIILLNIIAIKITGRK
ncbi:MAG: phosphate ABC transporter permease subunit PstC [Candidatus Stahlbacteria bacterium]|jgi:phosphate ABC transporter permease protein PstC|nr:phosphate ABC transporter permease subunit PstC [candidate division WOR-3 bacterium]TET61685.1 MAG: phosphate ABC transporter permease subunit PstC [Candidatus Stahlbacteria bacterium]